MIRTAQPHDLSALSELLTALVGYPPKSEVSLLGIMQEYTVGNNRILVYEDEGQVLGFVSLATLPMLHIAGHLARITAFCVSEEARGQGIGQQLLQAVVDYSQSIGCKRMEVTSGDRPERVAAHRFYENNGFKYDSKRFSRWL
ncbi:MAG: GNAT family N-acetyltransferase [Bacteroidota bacterium]